MKNTRVLLAQRPVGLPGPETWTVETVEHLRGIGYDLACVRNGEVHHVEVKGIRAARPSFTLTRSEHDAAVFDEGWRLPVVTRALTKRPLLKLYTGEELAAQFDREPATYRVTERREDD